MCRSGELSRLQNLPAQLALNSTLRQASAARRTPAVQRSYKQAPAARSVGAGRLAGSAAPNGQLIDIRRCYFETFISGRANAI